MNTRAYSLTFISAGLMTLVGLSVAAESKEYLKGDRPQQRGYSEAVITEGGRMVWLAGQTATLDDNGKSLASDFDGQVRQVLRTWIALCKRRVASSVTWCR
jgi:2-iminobutanoate/2-iminopropanoate deaminase